MPRFNTTGTRTATRSPVVTEKTPSGRTFEGAPGHARDAKSELFLLAVSHLGDGSFYETAGGRNVRLVQLVRTVTLADPAWTAAFIPWLRRVGNMRSAAVITAAEAAKALLDAGQPGGRRIVASALDRADEPGELLAYWRSRHGGGTIPKPVKRGLADAAVRLYTERALLKYDTGSHGYRFADVIELVRPAPAFPWQDDLFRFAIDRRHGHDDEIPGSLRMIGANARLRAAAVRDPRVLLRTDLLAEAGMTWEDVLSLAGSRLPKDSLWSALVPVMGYMATVRNLRGFDQAGLPDDVARKVAERIADPEQVAKSRQFPFRFLAAYQAASGSMRWGWPLEQALNASLANVPALPGRTLILVDRSASMFGPVSEKSGLNFADSAALFGTALALRSGRADLVEFGTDSREVRFRPGDSVLKVVERFGNLGGTSTAEAVRRWYDGHDRVVLVTDEQGHGGYRGADPLGQVPDRVPAYTWNLAGYRYGHGGSGSGTRHVFGGLTDAAFKMIPLIEAGRDARWADLFRAAASS